MSNSHNLALPYVQAAQAQKHVTVNDAFRRIDQIVQLSVEDRSRTFPPGTVEESDRYIVAAGAGGAWAGHAMEVAAYIDGAWVFFAPREGWIAYVKAEEAIVYFTGSSWQILVAAGDLDIVDKLGINGTASAGTDGHRLVVRSKSALFESDPTMAVPTGDMRIFVSKTSDEDVASLSFQNNFSTRAELGLIQSDDFLLKVSSGSSPATEALRVDSSSARVDFSMLPTVGGSERLLFSCPTRAELTATSVPPKVDRIETRGYGEEADGGGARYRRVGSEPGHPGKVRSGDGAWWEIDEAGGYDIRMFGAVGDGDDSAVNNPDIGTDNTEAFEDAMAAAAATGVALVLVPEPKGDFWRVSRAPLAVDGVTLRVPNPSTRIRTSAVAGRGHATWPLYSAGVQLGTLESSDQNMGALITSNGYPVRNVSPGEESVRLTNGGHAANFAVGDVVFLITTDIFDLGPTIRPAISQMNVIEGISGATITLRHNVDVTIGGGKARLVNLSDNGQNLMVGVGNTDDSGLPLKAVRDFHLIGGTWEAEANGAAFGGAGGGIDSTLSPDGVDASQLYSINMCARCRFTCRSARLRRKGVELAYSSHGNVVEAQNIDMRGAYLLNNPEVSGIRCVEGAYNNRVYVHTLSVGEKEHLAYAVRARTGQNNHMEIGYFRAGTCEEALVQFDVPAYEGTPPDTAYNTIIVRRAEVVAAKRWVEFGSEQEHHNVLRDSRFFGRVGADETFPTKAAMDGELRASNGTFAYVFADPTPANNGWYVKSGGWNTGSWNPSAPPAQDGVNAVWLDGGEGSKILNCHFENGRVLVDRSVRGEYELFIPGGIAKNRDLSMLDDNVYRVTSIAAHARRSMSRIFDQTSVEVGSPFNEIIAVPAGALARGAQVRIIMVAQTSGNGGNKSMRVAFGPAGSETTLAALTIPTGGRTSVIEIILRDSGSGRIASAIVQTMTADGPSADVVNLTGLDLEAVDYRLVLSGSVAANGDTMNMRHVAVEANSAFTDTPSYA